MNIYLRLRFLLIFLLILFSGQLLAQKEATVKSKTDKKKMSLIDAEDGAVDVSEFLESPAGFFPIPIIITEPALGYGGGAALCFFHPHKGKGGKSVTPNVTGVAGLGTQNKTWLAGIFHSNVFGEDKVRTMTAIAKPDIRIKYYGNNSEFLSKNPVTLRLNSWVVYQKAEVRLADSKWFVGASYTYFRAENSLDTIPGRPLLNLILERLKGTSTISMLQPRIHYDNRDNLFTPTKGFNAGFIFDYNAPWLGADEEYFALNPYMLFYHPFFDKLFSGWRFDGKSLIGDAPLYAFPYIQLRGIPAMRYQSDNTMVLETEWRYAFYKRWSVVGFTGAGKAFKAFDSFNDLDWAYTFGTGIRYKIAKIYGIHSGLDFAWGDGRDFAFYIVFGTSWSK